MAIQTQVRPPIDPVLLPPPPATPAGAGFAAWASDPQNAQKVANSIVPPGQSILPPNAPQAAAQAQAVPTASPAQPPLVASAPEVGAAPPFAASGAYSASAPAVTQPPPAAPAAQAPFPSYGDWAKNNPGQLATQLWQHQEGGGVTGALKDIGGLATAGLLGATGWYKGDPGAGVKFAMDRQAYDKSIPDINQARYKAAVIDPTQAGVALQDSIAQMNQRNSTADLNRQKPQLAQQKIAQLAAKSGQTVTFDEDGTPTFTDNPNSQAFKSAAALADMHSATSDKDAIQAEIQQNHYIPGTPEYAEAQRKLAQVDTRLHVALSALGIRAENLGLRKQTVNAALYGKDLAGNDLPGATHLEDDNGAVTTIGNKNAPTAIKQNAKVSTFKDLGGSVDRAEKSLQGIDLSDPNVVAVMADPKSMVGKIVGGKLVQGTLSPQQVQGINAIRQLHEQAGILRATTGGTAAEAQAQRILDTLPVAGDSPRVAASKLMEIRQVLGRLTPGVSGVAGGLTTKSPYGQSMSQPPAGPSAVPDGMITVQIPGQPSGQIHASQKAAFLAKYPNAKVK